MNRVHTPSIGSRTYGRLVAVISLFAFAFSAAVAASAVGPPFAIDWYTIDGGGGTSTGGNFSVSGTIGQPDAGAVMTGGTYQLTGGYWLGGAGNSCPADITNADGTGPDGVVDVFDLILVLDNWGTNGLGAAIAPDNNIVDVFDLITVLDEWGNCD